MPTTFSNSMRALQADGFRFSNLGIVLAAALLLGGGAWFFIAKVTVYEVTPDMRVEVANRVRPVKSPIPGEVVTSNLFGGREVKVGDVLLHLDAEKQQRELEVTRARIAGLPDQRSALEDQLAGIREARGAARTAAEKGIEEAQARFREAGIALAKLEEDRKRFARGNRTGAVSGAKLAEAVAAVEGQKEVLTGLQSEIGKLRASQQEKERGAEAAEAGLRRQIASLDGELATAQANENRLLLEIERRTIVARVDGRLSSVADLKTGAVIEAGDEIASILPVGNLQAVAYFEPLASLGRIRPGQAARLRMDAFPWAQYGSISAKVTFVSEEPRDGRIRVELEVAPDSAPRIPLKHGMPGQVEIEIEKVSPAQLLLRAVGKLVASAPPSSSPGAMLP